jgi:hypothetical protein
MDASTRLYSRLGEIPEDPNDPESLAELLVCAFGAFERYYVCWKTQGGEYRQGKEFLYLRPTPYLQMIDGYDLPPALNEWLYPADGTTRDFATLQIVFGRGEEYFASDKDGKLEFKEPEIKKPVEEEKELDKPALRRARTVSFLRPLSDISTRSEASTAESTESRRSSAASSRRASRPPSMSFSRTSSMSSETMDTMPDKPYQSSSLSQWEALDASTVTSNPSMYPSKRSSRSFEPAVVESISEERSLTPAKEISHALPQRTSPHISDFKVPEGYMLIPIQATETKPSSCTCTCASHSSFSPPSKPSYASTSTQTDNIPSPPRTALRIDTLATSRWSSNSCSAVSQPDIPTPVYDENPISLARPVSYFAKPGYQLGDSLVWGLGMGMGSHEPVVYEYEYQDTFGEEAMR